MQQFSLACPRSQVIVPNLLNRSLECNKEERKDLKNVNKELGMQERQKEHKDCFKELFSAIKKASARLIINMFAQQQIITEIYKESKAIQAHIVADKGKTS